MKNILSQRSRPPFFVTWALTSCETPAGQGAGFGALTGAAAGCADRCRRYRNRSRRGDRRRRGSVAGALIGAAVAEDQAQYYHAPPGGYPYARPDWHTGICLQSLCSAQHHRRSRRASGCVGSGSFDRRNFPEVVTLPDCWSVRYVSGLRKDTRTTGGHPSRCAETAHSTTRSGVNDRG